MKKYLKLTFLLLLLLMAPVVYADGEQEGDNNENAAWPKSFEYGDYKYSINGFIVNVYETNIDSPEVTEQVQSGSGTITVTMTEDEKNYVEENPTRSFELSAEEFTINPTYKVDSLSGMESLFIDLDLNLTKEKLEQLLADEMSAVTAEKSYLVDLCIQYRFTQVPSKYLYAYKFDSSRLFATAYFMTEMPEVEITELNQIVLNRLGIELNDEGEAELYYTDVIDEENAVSFMNYIGFSTERIEGEGYLPDGSVMFHNVSNIEFLFDDDNDIESPLTSGEVVKVDDTAKILSRYIYIGSALLILLGISIVFIVIHQKQKEIRE